MKHALFRFYAELNDFLPPTRRGRSVEHAFTGAPAVKDSIEALGVPHAEVELILVDGASVGFEHPVADGARVSVYPRFERFDLGELRRLRREPLRSLTFLLDGHLGRLAPRLRMLGFDAELPPSATDAELAERSAREGRILLTRDVGLLKRSQVERGAFVRATDPAEQLREIVDRFDLRPLFRPFTRCLRCNTPLVEATPAQVEATVPPRVREREREFRACPRCARLFWRGTHHARMAREIAALSPAG